MAYVCICVQNDLGQTWIDMFHSVTIVWTSSSKHCLLCNTETWKKNKLLQTSPAVTFYTWDWFHQKATYYLKATKICYAFRSLHEMCPEKQSKLTIHLLKYLNMSLNMSCRRPGEEPSEQWVRAQVFLPSNIWFKIHSKIIRWSHITNLSTSGTYHTSITSCSSQDEGPTNTNVCI